MNVVWFISIINFDKSANSNSSLVRNSFVIFRLAIFTSVICWFLNLYCKFQVCIARKVQILGLPLLVCCLAGIHKSFWSRNFFWRFILSFQLYAHSPCWIFFYFFFTSSLTLHLTILWPLLQIFPSPPTSSTILNCHINFTFFLLIPIHLFGAYFCAFSAYSELFQSHFISFLCTFMFESSIVFVNGVLLSTAESTSLNK